MARIIGERPKDMAMMTVWNFIQRELPDYVYGVISPVFSNKNSETECDFALFIPHMGVFLLDVNNPSEIVYEEGQFFSVYGYNKRPFAAEMERKRMLDRRNRVRQYLHDNYHFDPLVFEMTGFPLSKISEEMKKEMGRVLDTNHVLFREDFENGSDFLVKIYRKSLEVMYGNREPFSEMMDEMAYLLFSRWGVGLPDPPRPDKPPMVFMSYNRNSQIRAWEIKYELEKRNLFVWRAPEDVAVSTDYKILETQAIKQCDAFLLLLTSKAMESDEVRYEFETAKHYGKTIIPIVIEDTEITDYYKKQLSHIQYRTMIVNDANVFDEIEKLIKKKNNEE